MTCEDDTVVSARRFCTAAAMKQTNFALMLTQKMGNVKNEENPLSP